MKMKLDLEKIFPKSLYKYRNFSNPKHLEIITKQEIYFANPDEFNATHDCTYKIDREQLTHSNSKITKEQIDKEEKESQEFLFQTTGILSVSKSYKNKELWTSFGKNNEGFCVELNLHDSLPLNVGSKGLVRYVEEKKLPKRKIHNESIMDYISFYDDFIFKLPVKYKDEEEYRIEINIERQKDRKYKIKKEHIKTIFLGHNITKSNKEKIISLTKEHLPDCKIKHLDSENNIK